MRLLRLMRRHVAISAGVILSITLTIGLYAIGPSVMAAPAPGNMLAQTKTTPFGGMTGQSNASSVSSCALDQIGWIVCPMVRSVAIVADSAFTFITKDFLVVDIDLFSNSSTTNAVWSAMRNIANVLFVMAFLVIVYSLITGTGVTNYDLKRLVPRLLIAAILVNISFFVCQLAIDFFTVLGAWLLEFMKAILGSGTTTGMPLDKSRDSLIVLAEIASQTLANTKVAWILLAPMIAIIFSAAVICSVILVILILRKVAIVALVLLAPLAFVAYLLPNTEQYFSKWMKLFVHLLLIFPIVALLLGTGQVVSAAIIKSGDSAYKQNGDEYTTTNGGGQASATLRLIAAGAAILPLAGTWYAFKGMTALMDSAGVRIANGRRGERRGEHSEKEVSRREAALDLNKKSQMLNGVNKIQQLTAIQDGATNVSLLGRMGRRNYKKTVMKSAEQKEFDAKVQDRLEELRGSGNIAPQQAYLQALQRYQDKQADSASGGSNDSFNINSYEGIDLKASEAYLLESLGKGAGNTTNTTNSIQNTNNSANNNVANNNSNTTTNQNQAANGKADDKKDDKKAAGISSLDRNGKAGDGGSGQKQADEYHAPTANSQAALANALDSVGIASGSSSASSAPGGGGGASAVIVDGGNVPAAVSLEHRSSDRQRPTVLTGTEMKAKARAAKYLAQSQNSMIAPPDSDDDDSITSIEEALKKRAAEAQQHSQIDEATAPISEHDERGNGET